MKKIDAVIKIGGSVIRNKEKLSNICTEICNLSNDYNIIVITGGGKIADEVRNIYAEYDISDKKAHWMAILSMDINGILLSNFNKKFSTTREINKCYQLIENNFVPIFLTFDLLKSEDELPKSWDVTSDSIAIYIAEKLKAGSIVLLKDVEGVYKNIQNKNGIINTIKASDLERMDETCVDEHVPKLVKKYRRDVYVMSGFQSDRLVKLFGTGKMVGTKITYQG